MIKKILISGFAVATTLIMISAINKQTSTGAPSASTGAPDEQTCTMSGCHDDNTLNSGTAKLTVEVGKFGANKTKGLPIKIKMADAGKIRFGFQVTALDANNKKIGQFIVTDSIKTQVIGEKVGIANREYLTYTYYGTMGSKSGELEWEANWAPDELDLTKPGKVWFYVAALAANNDGQDKGDFTYTTTATASWETTLKKADLKRESNISVSIAQSELTIQNPQFNFIKTISITDISGKLILAKILKSTDKNTNITL
ncbi:MAG: choice-of-anchor V domain-containing protein, partial [Bacteroidia bacterium]